MDANPPRKPASLLSRAQGPLLFAFMTLLALAGYYFFYASAKSDYFVGRNFRLLTTLGSQVDDALRSTSWRLRSLGSPAEGARGPKPRARRRQRHVSAEQIERTCEPVAPAKDGKRPFERFDKVLQADADGYRLEFRRKADRKDKSDPEPCGSIFLADLLDPRFGTRREFEALLLADEEGKVVYSHGPVELAVERLDLLLPPVAAKSATGAAARMPLADLLGASRRVDVEPGGRAYRLFVQPVSLSMVSSTQSSGKSRHIWLMCGLVPKGRFTYESLSVPPSLLALLAGVLLLGSLGWPLVKLELIGERQRLRRFDVLWLGISSLLGASLLTLLAADVFALGRLRDQTREQLRGFAVHMAENLRREIGLGYKQLVALEARAAQKERREARSHGLREWAGDALATYPHAQGFSLVDAGGEQARNWAVDPDAPASLWVEDRDYFKAVRDGTLWTLPGTATTKPAGPLFVESVRARTTGKRSAVIAKPAVLGLAGGFTAATLTLPMLSAIGPVIPPGSEFAVIDDRGRVLFHSDAERNQVEDFFVETDKDRHLRAAVVAHREEDLGVQYWGQSYQASTAVVPGVPWTVVALRNGEALEALNLQWLVTSGLFVALYVGSLALAAFVIAVVRPRYRASWSWPDARRPGDFARLSVVLGLLVAAFAITLVRQAGGGDLIRVSWLMPPLSLAATYLVLAPRGSGVRRALLEAAAILLLVLLLAILLRLATVAGYLAGALAVTALGLAVSDRVGAAAWRLAGALPVRSSYPAAGLLLLLLIGPLPTLGIFKTVHRLQLDCFVKHGQLELAKALNARVRGARRVAVPPEPETRLGIGAVLANSGRPVGALDYYGDGFFATTAIADVGVRSDAGGGTEDELPEVLEQLLPRYSEDMAELRELLHDRSSDGSWTWHREEKGLLELHSRDAALGELRLRSHLDPQKPAPATAQAAGVSLLPAAAQAGTAGLARSTALVPPLLLLAAFAALALFVARKVFLVDLGDPLGETLGAPPVGPAANAASEPAAMGVALPPPLGDECGADPHLLQIGRGLAAALPLLGREQLLEELGERAEDYYRALWAGCSPDEKVVLEHLAEEGFVHAGNRRTLRRLMARGLVRRAPEPRLSNETFRRFLVSPACRGEVLALEEDEGPSAWDRFRRPFFAILAVSIAFFLATQHDLLDGATAIATGVAAGLPLLAKVVDMLGSRSAAHSGTPGAR